MNRMALVCAVVGLLGVIFTALHAPYSAARPKRLLAAQADNGEQSALLVAAYGADGMQPLADRLRGVAEAPGYWPKLHFFTPAFTHLLPAGPPAMAAPQAEVTATNYDAAADQRQVNVHLTSGGPQMRLFIPAAPLLAWSVTPSLPAAPPLPGQYCIIFEGVEPGGVDLQLTLRGWQPVEIELRSVGGEPANGPEVQALGQRLPDWVSLTTYAYRIARVKI
jgi:hypothetical protein